VRVRAKQPYVRNESPFIGTYRAVSRPHHFDRTVANPHGSLWTRDLGRALRVVRAGPDAVEAFTEAKNVFIAAAE
jgi:hypothetical protein